MVKNNNRFILAGFFIAWLVDYFFYQKPFGIAFFLWIFISIAALFLFSFLEKTKPHRFSYVLAAAALFLSTGSFTRMEPFTRFATSTGSILLLILLTITFLNGNWFYYRLLDYLLQGFIWLVAILSRPIGLMFQNTKKEADSSMDSQSEGKHKKDFSVWQIVRGFLIVIPILLVMGTLLTNADPIFKQNLEQLFKFTAFDNLEEFLFRLVYVLILGYLFIGVLLNAILPKKIQARPATNQPSFPKFLGSVETNIVFLSINILFAAFLLVQFRYFFGGEANINVTGFTYAEYARRGFGEILAVAVLTTMVYYFFLSITKLTGKKEQIIFSTLIILIFAQVLIMLVSSYQRLVLYEQAYGFSRLRTYTHLFLPWLALLIVVIMVLEISRRQGHLALSILLVMFGFVVTTLFFNVDGLIAKQNIQRANQSQKEGFALDYFYLSSLSTDAVPQIFQGYQTANPVTKDMLGANLACRWHSFQNTEKRPWQSFNFSEQKAQMLLAENQNQWINYPVTENSQFPGYQGSINNQTFDCYSFLGFID